MTEDEFRAALLEALRDIGDSLRILVDAVDRLQSSEEEG
jgi:hypothetical protein